MTDLRERDTWMAEPAAAPPDAPGRPGELPESVLELPPTDGDGTDDASEEEGRLEAEIELEAVVWPEGDDEETIGARDLEQMIEIKEDSSFDISADDEGPTAEIEIEAFAETRLADGREEPEGFSDTDLVLPASEPEGAALVTDAGEEGFDEGMQEVGESALPPLDDGDDGEFEEPWMGELPAEWSDAHRENTWSLVRGAGTDTPLVDATAAQGGIVALGESLLWLAPDRQTEARGAAGVDLALVDQVRTDDHGRLWLLGADASFVSRDAGASFRESSGAPAPCDPDDFDHRGGFAVRSGTGGVLERIDPSGRVTIVACERPITAAALVDDRGTIAVATFDAADAEGDLVLAPVEGSRLTIAHLGPSPRLGDGRVAKLIWDAPRELLWAIGRFGAVAYAHRDGALADTDG